MSSQRASTSTLSRVLFPSDSPSSLPATDSDTPSPSSHSQLTPSSSDSSEPSSTSRSRHDPSSVPVIAGSLAGCIVLVATILTFLLLNKRRKRLRAERLAAFYPSRNPNPSISLRGHPGTPSGYDLDPPPRLQEPSLKSPSAPSSPTRNHHQKRHTQHTHNHHPPHLRQQQQHVAQSSVSSSSAQSQTPLLSNAPTINTISGVPHGRDDLDGGSTVILVDSDTTRSGPSAGVPKIVVTGDAEVNGDGERVGYVVVDKKKKDMGGDRGRKRFDQECGEPVERRRDRDRDGRRSASRSHGSVSGEEYTYHGYDENGGGRIGEAGRGMFSLAVGDAADQAQVSLRTSGSATGSVSVVLGSLPPSPLIPPSSHSHHSFVAPPPSPTISTASSSYYPHPQNGDQDGIASLAPLISRTHPSHPSSFAILKQQQQQRQEFSPIPTYSESRLHHTLPSAGGQNQASYTHTHIPLVVQRGTGVQEEEAPPPAYENVWTSTHQQREMQAPSRSSS